MTDERAALIESLARGEPCAADACLSRLPDNCQCAHAAFMLASDAAEIARLSEEARALREALAPFAKEADVWPDYVPDGDGLFIASPDDVHPILDEYAGEHNRANAGISFSDDTVAVGDLRKARAALARAKGETE